MPIPEAPSIAPARNARTRRGCLLRSGGKDGIYVLVWRARSLLRGMADAKPEAVYLSAAEATPWRSADTPWAFLGVLTDRPVFTLDVSSVEEPLGMVGAGHSFEDLRATAGALAPDEGSILAHARGLMHWRSRHRFCGICGGACAPASAGHVMICTQCKTHHFPRTDPAVIMLVTRGDKVLLGHSQRFPKITMYSTLAGFVEPGESLEEAVAREVLEESAIRVGSGVLSLQPALAVSVVHHARLLCRGADGGDHD